MPNPTSGLASQFTIESHLMSTRSADASKAIDKERGLGVCLWMLRHPLPHNSEAVRRFLTRIARLKEIDPAVTTIERSGVDPSGMAYVVMPAIDGSAISSGNLEVYEAERRFVGCLKLVERIHAAGIVCGDLCASSFLASRDGEIKFIGVMGSFDSEAAATAMLPPMETLNFVAPEQRAGGGLEPASDVFALGVLGYQLFTGTYPYPTGAGMLSGNLAPEQIKPISHYVAVPPVWAEEVLMKCLSPKPTSRYSNAGEVMRAIIDIRRRVESKTSSPTAPQREIPGRVSSQGVRSPAQTVQAVTAHRPVPSTGAGGIARPRLGNQTMRIILALIGLVAVAASTAFLLSRGDATRDLARQKELAEFQKLSDDKEVKEAISIMGKTSASPAELEAQREALVNSNDPLAHELLVTAAKTASSEEARTLSEKAILDRARRQGLIRATEQVRQWLRTIKGGDLPGYYDTTLRVIDSAQAQEAKNKGLKQIYASNPKLALRLAAALALDGKSSEEFQPILSQLLTDYALNPELAGRAAISLMLFEPELALVYGDDLIQRRDQIPDKDTLWVLKILAERNDQSVRAVANLALEKNLLPPLKRIFVELARDRSELPADVLRALARSAAGTPTPADVGTFGRWYDVQSERVLFAIMADSSDKAVLLEAFDIASGKSLTTEPSAALVAWIRRNQWDNRAEFAQCVGILGSIESLGPEAIAPCFPIIDKYSKDRKFLDMFLESKNPVLVRALVARYSGKIGIAGLMNLLSHPDEAVRITAVTSLKDVNEIAILKLILERYEEEKSPAVRQAYRDNFWMIKGRDDN